MSLHKRDLTVSKSLPVGWESQSCWTDNVNSRSLYSAAYTDGTAMTEESCIAFCSSKGYVYAGVEYSQECCELGAKSVATCLCACPC
jgi:WSC domain